MSLTPHIAPARDFSTATIGDLATSLPGATAIFRAHKLDFCCGGQTRLIDAAAEAGIPWPALTAELEALTPPAAPVVQTTEAMVAFILERFHATHRRELPELERLARRVEAVHQDKPDVPAGLADFLVELTEALELHMQKEEQVLFPMMLRGAEVGGHITMPISMMRHEHDEHGANLRKLARFTNEHVPPEAACGTWRALYAGTKKLTDDVMDHIALENNVLFTRFGG
jgi:regulator of cell morphogenesis and NO signaling